jgi:transposase
MREKVVAGAGNSSRCVAYRREACARARPQAQLFTWRRLVAQGALTAAGSGEEVVPASDYRALQSQVRELQRLLGKKTLEAENLKEASRMVAAAAVPR